MPICLISCLWLCLAQIYMLVCMFYAPMLMSYAFTCLYAWICVLPCFYAYIHMLRCTFTCPHAYFHAYTCRSVCLHAQIDVLYMLYAIIYVLVCSIPCLSAYTQAMFVMPCATVALLSFFSLFLMFWLIGSNLIQTVWSLLSSIHQGPHQRVWITLIYMSMFSCFYALSSMLAILVLGFAMLDGLSGFVVVWLHLM